MTQTDLFDFVKDDSKYHIKKFTQYQYRFNHAIDIYPVNKRYHIIATGERGEYTDLEKFLEDSL